MPLSAKVCRICGSSWHTAWRCPRKPHKPMNRIGKVQKNTNAAVAKWKNTQQPNHQGYFLCYLCSRWVTYLVAEHTLSKARHPEFRTDTSKLRPVCNECNAKKGSKDVDNSIDNADREA